MIYLGVLVGYKENYKQLKGRFAIVRFYHDLLRKGIIKIDGYAHKRMKELDRRNYEKASKG